MISEEKGNNKIIKVSDTVDLCNIYVVYMLPYICSHCWRIPAHVLVNALSFFFFLKTPCKVTKAVFCYSTRSIRKLQDVPRVEKQTSNTA